LILIGNINYIFLILGFISLLSTILLLPGVRKIGLWYKIIDDLDPRKMHSKPKVRLGGLAIITAFFFTLYVLFAFINYGIIPDIYLSNYVKIIIFSTSLAFLIGLLDDIYTIPYWLRLICQIILSVAIWFFGINIKIIDVSFLPFLSENYFYLDNYHSIFINILWFCGITNSINWMDGLDGLAAGITLIISFGLIFISIFNGNLPIAFLSTILAGSCLGFLKDNSYPSKIMMGDGGSYFLGSILAVLSIIAIKGSDGQVNLFIPLTLFFVPIIDMTYVIFSRVKNGLSPFYPDKRHLHHRLIKFGFSYKRTVYTIYLLNFAALISSMKILT